MSVEQTSQLIQLILNSVLMITACVIALSGLLMRHAAITDRLKMTHQEYFQLFGGIGMLRSDRLVQLKHQLRWLRQRYRTAYRSVLVVHYALLLFVLSTLVISLRATLYLDWLIPGGIILFIAGMVVLLLGVGLALIDFHTSGQPFWEELNGMLGLGKMDKVQRDPRLVPSNVVRPLPPRVVRSQQPRRRTGTA